MTSRRADVTLGGATGDSGGGGGGRRRWRRLPKRARTTLPSGARIDRDSAGRLSTRLAQRPLISQKPRRRPEISTCATRSAATCGFFSQMKKNVKIRRENKKRSKGSGITPFYCFLVTPQLCLPASRCCHAI